MARKPADRSLELDYSLGESGKLEPDFDPMFPSPAPPPPEDTPAEVEHRFIRAMPSFPAVMGGAVGVLALAAALTFLTGRALTSQLASAVQGMSTEAWMIDVFRADGIVGLDAKLLVFWAALILIPVAIAWVVERGTRRPWISAVLLAGLGAIPFALGLDPEMAFGWDDILKAAIDAPPELLAMNVPARTYLIGAAFAAGYAGSRYSSRAAMFVAALIAAFAVYEMGLVRSIEWTGLVNDSFQQLAHGEPLGDRANALRQQTIASSRPWLWGRSFVDWLLLYAPALAFMRG